MDFAKGSILGAFIGDSAGAFLEFYREEITKKEVNKALTFPGGGCFKLDPGQFTDDSEMALGMIKGLLNSEKEFVVQEEIAYQYINWYWSNPFDIGIATTKAAKLMHQALTRGSKYHWFGKGNTL